MVLAAPCELLAWDTKFFGRRIARARVQKVDLAALDSIEFWCRQHRIDCVYLLMDAGDRDTLATLHGTRFRLVDVRLILERDTCGAVDVPVECDRVRTAHSSEVEELCSLARNLHVDSRFFFDPGFPDQRCRDLYATWMRRSLSGWADLVLAGVDDAGSPAGYVTCHLEPSRTGRIGLLGVAAAAQGAGLGRRLVESAVAWLGARGAERVEVVTQARNSGAQRFYLRRGFLTREVGVWYHGWFDGDR